MISSTSNRQVKEVIQLQSKHKARSSSGFFVIEGSRLLLDAPAGTLAGIYYASDFAASEKGKEVLGKLRAAHPGAGLEETADRVFAHMSDTATPQGILGVAKQPSYTLEELLAKEPPCLLLLESLQDPGNLGTIFRTAEGAGATGIVMNRFTADIFHPKTVRATMGSIFRMPFYIAQDWEQAVAAIRRAEVALYAAALDAADCYDRFDYRGACGFMIGNEGNGLSAGSAAMADNKLRIPMEGQLESLNAAMAAGILVYEANRQRRHG